MTITLRKTSMWIWKEMEPLYARTAGAAVFGDNGVFYVSYYDTNVGTHNVVYTDIESADNYDNIYQSDLCGWVGKMGYDKEDMYGANIFTAQSAESLRASGFYATAADTSYKLYVVKNFENEYSF